MKTRVIALILAVFMMLGLCAFASASTDAYSDCTCVSGPRAYYYTCGSGGTHVYCSGCGVTLAIYGCGHDT